MDDLTDLRLAGLLASRLCHDLVGPLGAVGNGLELMAEDDAMSGEAMALAQRSARRATGRLQLFRFAFGTAGGEPHFGPAEARPVALDLLHGATGCAVDWPAGLDLPPADGAPDAESASAGRRVPAAGGRLVVGEDPCRPSACMCEGAHSAHAAGGEGGGGGRRGARRALGAYRCRPLRGQRLAKALGWSLMAADRGWTGQASSRGGCAQTGLRATGSNTGSRSV